MRKRAESTDPSLPAKQPEPPVGPLAGPESELDTGVIPNAHDESVAAGEAVTQAPKTVVAGGSQNQSGQPQHQDGLSAGAAPNSTAADSPTTGHHRTPAVLATTLPRLKAEAADLGGPSALIRFNDVPDSGIDISKAHPGSLPQFFSGRSTLLSNLYRDEVGLRSARIAAEAISAKHNQLVTVRGIDAVRLAVGLATWRIGGVAYSAPVLLRPVTMRRHHGDFDISLKDGFFVNPALVRIMQSHFGISVDARSLASLTYDNSVFTPQRVIDSLRAATLHIDTFGVHPRLIVSVFAEVGESMAQALNQVDLTDPGSTVLNALLGSAADQDRLRAASVPAVVTSPDERAPASDVLLLDADTEQEQVLAEITHGSSLAVITLPGTGGTQTIINALGELVRSGKRVLVVAARRSTRDGMRHRLRSVGLDGLMVSPGQFSRDLVRAIGRNEKAQQPKTGEVDEALLRLRGVLQDYRAALTKKRDGLGVSVLDATRALTRLALLPTPPSTAARLSTESLQLLARDRRAANAALAHAARLGEFRFGPDDSPWYGIDFAGPDQARAAHDLAGRLHSIMIPGLLQRGYELIAQTRLRPFATVDDLGQYLRLLQGLRESLDKFTPAVFERPLGEVIQAHTGRGSSGGISSANRRRLKQLAREYVRPGAQVPDMYEALGRISQQRNLWLEIADGGGMPEIPLGLADVYVAWQRAEAELSALDQALGRRERLAALPVELLVRTLAGLAAPSEVFDNLVERTQIRARLREFGLEPLLTELSVRHVDEEQVEQELEFAWWQSALEQCLYQDRSLLGANTAVVDRLERDFRLVDEAHAVAAGPLLAWQLANQWRIGIVDETEQARLLRHSLLNAEPGSVVAQTVAAAPTLIDILAPVWMASPYEVGEIPDSVHFDAVLLLDAAALTLAEAAPALRRAPQVVAFGDPVTQRPTAFEVAVSPPEADSEVPADEISVLERLRGLLPVKTLTKSYRAGGEDLANLVNEAFYGGEIDNLPWAGSFLGRDSLIVDYIAGGIGTADPLTGAMESPDAEVARVVTLVVEHALHRPSESLMVVAVNHRHAERIRTALIAAFTGRADVAEFIERDTAEPFAVLTLEESVAESRDRVVLTLGYGVTRHGRVLSDFGDLSGPDGDRLLAVGMTRGRRSMVIVSCIRPEDVDSDRLSSGAATLMTLLAGVGKPAPTEPEANLADPLALALARELRKLGAEVVAHYQGRLPLVARYQNTAVVIESDPQVQTGSLRGSLRLRPHVLRRLGWHYVRVHAFDLYSNPASVARRVAEVLGLVKPELPTTAGSLGASDGHEVAG